MENDRNHSFEPLEPKKKRQSYIDPVVLLALKKAIQEGFDSGIAHGFDWEKNLQQLKAKRKANN